MAQNAPPANRPQIVTTATEAIESLHQYHGTVTGSASKAQILIEVMPHIRAWYALEHGGEWIFGPSKFIGYHGMTVEEYKDKDALWLDGRETERVLRKLARPPSSSRQEKELRAALHSFLARFGKRPSTLARILVLEAAGNQGADPAEIADALLMIYQQMPDEARKEFKRRLAA